LVAGARAMRQLPAPEQPCRSVRLDERAPFVAHEGPELLHASARDLVCLVEKEHPSRIARPGRSAQVADAVCTAAAARVATASAHASRRLSPQARLPTHAGASR